MDMTALAGVEPHSFSEAVEKFARNSEPIVVFEQVSDMFIFLIAQIFLVSFCFTEWKEVAETSHRAKQKI